MYLEHYGLGEAPFRITPHTDFFFAGGNRGATLDALLYAVVCDEGIIKISGEVGSGKTMLCRVLMERLPPGVVIVYLANPSLAREDILYALAEELGVAVPENARAGSVMRVLQEALVALYAEGRQVVVLIDEAHAMPMETLEQIRLLSNLESNRHKLLKLVLFGQPELDETLLRTDMRQLRERITHSFTLVPLVRDDIAAYLDFRLRAAGYRGPALFSPGALKLIAAASQGLTRRINILADKSLLAAYAAGIHRVDLREARAAVRDADFAGIGRPQSRQSLRIGLLWAFGGAGLMLLAMFAWQYRAATGGADVAAPPPASPPAETPATASAPPPQTSPGQTSAAPVVEPSPAWANRAPRLAALLADTRPWIDTVGDERWFVQLFTTADDSQPERVEHFIGRAVRAQLDVSALRAYHSDLAGWGRFGVIYGDFATRAEASRALRDLPEEIRRHRPFIRQAIRLKPPRNMSEGD